MTRFPLLLLFAAGLHASAGAADDPINSVEVQGMRNPEMRTYRSVVAGLDAFDEYRSLAPNAAPLRFHFWSDRHDGARDPGMKLRISGKGDPIYLPVSDDGEFTVPRLREPYDDDADLILNRKEHSYRSEPIVRTVGLAPDVMRLGDMRLSCRVTVAIAKYEMGFMLRTFINGLLRTTDWCGYKDINWGFPTRQRIRGAYIEEGSRSAKLDVVDHWRVPMPLGMATWSDDALVHLDFAPAAPTADKPAQFDAQPIYLRGTMDKWGTANALVRQADGSYRAEIALSKGKHRFKVGSDDFIAIDFGARAGQSETAVDAAKPLIWGGGNLSYTAAEPGNYAFVLTVADPSAPQLVVTRLH